MLIRYVRDCQQWLFIIFLSCYGGCERRTFNQSDCVHRKRWWWWWWWVCWTCFSAQILPKRMEWKGQRQTLMQLIQNFNLFFDLSLSVIQFFFCGFAEILAKLLNSAVSLSMDNFSIPITFQFLLRQRLSNLLVFALFVFRNKITFADH